MKNIVHGFVGNYQDFPHLVRIYVVSLYKSINLTFVLSKFLTAPRSVGLEDWLPA